jgi:hypothetical protein
MVVAGGHAMRAMAAFEAFSQAGVARDGKACQPEGS